MSSYNICNNYTDLDIESGAFQEILEKDVEDYKTSRHLVYGIDTKRPLTLMDLATISMKELRKTGYLDDLEVSEEINACSVELKIHTSEGDEDWLLMFKNETHNPQLKLNIWWSCHLFRWSNP